LRERLDQPRDVGLLRDLQHHEVVQVWNRDLLPRSGDGNLVTGPQSAHDPAQALAVLGKELVP
jgi:hypothetical protein